MKVRAQIGMVMNLDKCIGCHTCSVTCKNVWTNRPGTEYVWFNNVETKPGRGYPRDYEDQERWNGGWKLDRKGRLELKAGGRLKKLASIFWNPDLPTLDDYYEPWTYDYEHLISAPASEHQPVARPKSLVSGEDLDLQWGPNWDDDLAASKLSASADPNRRNLEDKVKIEFEKAFMMYLPRICEHCINPSCVASCPSGAMYKREEDGIVLVDQEACRSWRFCVSGCPYKKVYFNWNTGKAEKCNFCYPRIEAGLTTVCSETCVGRLRHVGIVLIDTDRVEAAASVPDEHDLLDAQLDLMLDPEDPEVREQALRDGIAPDWLEAARRSPVYAMCKRWRIALPLHPEYRTMPMVWYVPPLSPVEALVDPHGGELDPDRLFAAVEELRIPIEYLAEFLSAGDPEPVRRSLSRLAAMRRFMRAANIDGRVDTEIARDVGMEPAEIEDMFQMVAIGDYDDRYVIPRRHGEDAPDPFGMQGTNGVDFAGCSVSGDASADTDDTLGAPADVVAAARFDLRDRLVRRNGDADG